MPTGNGAMGEGQGQQAKGQRQRHPLWQALVGDVARSFNAVCILYAGMRCSSCLMGARERGSGTAVQLLTLPAFMISPQTLAR